MDRRPHALGEALHQGQALARPLRSAGELVLTAVEGLEDPGQLTGGNARTVVTHAQLAAPRSDLTLDAGETHTNVATVCGLDDEAVRAAERRVGKEHPDAMALRRILQRVDESYELT